MDRRGAAALALLPHVSSFFKELSMRWARDTAPPFSSDDNWTAHLELMEDVERAGSPFITVGYGGLPQVEFMRYARASFLLGWSGSTSSALMYRPPGPVDPWEANWTADIGAPMGPRTSVGVGWMRLFEGGVVVVNPAAVGAQAFDLGGPHVDQDGVSRRGISLGPTSAMVLRNP